MIWFLALVTIVTQVSAVMAAANAEHVGWQRDKSKRNRWAFSCIVMSVAALLSAYRIGVNMAGC